MLHNTFCRRLAALVLTLAVAVSAVLPVFAVYPMPIQTATETEAVYLFNADTGKTLLTQNADQPRYVASLTKMMTALLLLESGKDLNGEVTVPTDLTQEFKDIQNANGTTMGLRIGETVRRIDLLNALLITSANAAASVIAWDVGGSLNAFIQQMNARAAELGCTSATFTCAHGLYDYGNVASAEDMAKIAAACAANETFAQVAGSTTYTLGQTNFHSEQRTISSSNPLMDASGAYYKDSVKWVKGGFTTLAGRCAVALAQKDGHTYGLVILGSDSNEHLYSECDELFDWAFASFADRPLVDTQTVVTTVDLTKCRTHPEVELYAAAPVSVYGHADDKVSYSFDLPESVSATVKNGQKLGTATVYLDGYEVGQVDLVTHQEYVSDFRTDSRSTLLLLKFQRDVSIAGVDSEKCELVTPILKYEDIPLLQELIRRLRKAKAKSDATRGCGVHIHIGANGHTAQTLRNLANIMASHESLIASALNISQSRINNYCRMVSPKFLDNLNRRKPRTMSELADIWYTSNGANYGRTQHYNDSRYHMLNLHATFTKGTVEFRLFQFDAPSNGKQNGLHAGQLKSYIQLCIALSQMAKTLKSASPKPQQTENPKYAMRTWLLRLGFIGEEFATAREILTKHLDGDASFRNGRMA